MAPLASSPPLSLVVTDMSGFTRTTRKYGIIHMTSLIWKTRQTLRALFEHYGALSIRTEADNNFATFSDPSQALAAALQVQRVIDAQNAVADDTLQITMGGVGVAHGEVKETEHLFTGTGFFDAFALGEDVSGKREVLVTKAVRDVVEGAKGFEGVTFEEKTDEEFHDGGKAFYLVQGMPSEMYEMETERLTQLKEVGEVAKSVGFEEGEVVEKFIAPMLSRFAVGKEEREAVDKEIESGYLGESAVLMYGAGWDAVAEKNGMEYLEKLQREAKEIVDKAIGEEYGGHVVEEALFIFEDTVDAVAAAVKLRESFKEHGDIPYTGFGVHMGKLLFAEGTDVHWGDPVNTSSKLGQDYCKNGEIVVSDAAWEQAEKEAEEKGGKSADVVKGLKVDVVEGITISGVDFRAYSVQ